MRLIKNLLALLRILSQVKLIQTEDNLVISYKSVYIVVNQLDAQITITRHLWIDSEYCMINTDNENFNPTEAAKQAEEFPSRHPATCSR